MTTNKEIWYQNERLVKQYFEKLWYTALEQNFTIRGGEIDLLLRKGGKIKIVEVKTVNYLSDFSKYITPNKIHYLQRTWDQYLYKSDLDYDEVSIDVVFVKSGEIVEHYENVTNN